MIKQLSVAAATVATIALAPTAAHAYDGTVTFTGSLSGATCTVKVNGANQNGTVQLPSVGASSLASKGATTGATNFTIALSDCTNADGKSVRAFFEAGPTVNTNDGTLANRANVNAATNVAVQLLDIDGKALKAGDISQRNGGSVALTNNSATLVYGAQYYATAAATAGSVNTSVTYSIDYL
ncbi:MULTISPECIES: fimbrial protein [Burkholderia]|uniref:Fimbrial family protein n=1 Tax=Burkholderia cepacia TaxID=292 RepID=A0AA89CJD6_BURCE|nr:MULTISPECIES: fimbrial protein [Burkholderia]AOI77219.1 fimbrial protein [Burkholderia sp. NRF60-BP8]KGC08134.1 fimbrial family protein [Burkholderia cepacia]KVA15617.1 fimbrial protein [Burkholderia sp. NRF60-BP8]KVL10461.1 fimbrial protein [Burkholderia sp. MSMB1826]KVL41183.1 fimbrial protein [Burkholderia sp. MSMB1835]